MAETDWNNDWNWDMKSEDYMEGYVTGSHTFVCFINGYQMEVIKNECIFYFEDDE